MRKFVRRNRPQVVTAGLVLATLLAGVVGTTIGLFEAKRQQRAAVAAREDADARRVEAEDAREAEAQERKRAESARQAEADQRKKAEAKEAEAEAVVKFVETKVFAAAGPLGKEGGLGKDVTLREAVAASLPALTREFADQPMVEARLRFAVGKTFMTTSNYQAAADQFERRLAVHLRCNGPEHHDTLEAMQTLMIAHSESGRHPDACKLGEDILATRRRVLGPDHAETLKSMGQLAVTYTYAGRHPDAVRLCGEALIVQKRVLPTGHPDTLMTTNNLATCYITEGRPKDALPLCQEVLAARRRTLGPDDAKTLRSEQHLAACYSRLGRLPEALRAWEEALASHQRVLGPDHPDTLVCASEVAINYSQLNRPQDSLKLAESAHAGLRRTYGPDHEATLRCTGCLAVGFVALNRTAEAVPLIDEYVTKATGWLAQPSRIRPLVELRMVHFSRVGDAGGCRTTAEMWERLHPATAEQLSAAGRMRAIAAGYYANDKRPAESAADADRAMAWLTKAVAAGYRGRLSNDGALAALRGRADFRNLLASLPELAPAPRPAK